MNATAPKPAGQLAVGDRIVRRGETLEVVSVRVLGLGKIPEVEVRARSVSGGGPCAYASSLSTLVQVASPHTTPSAFTCSCPECADVRAEVAKVNAMHRAATAWGVRDGSMRS